MTDVVRTTSGDVSGTTDEGAHVFLGVPFAAPPVGERRFAAPAPVQRWDGVRECVRFGPTAPQRDPGITIIPEPVEHGDDFLNLNITTPELGDAKLPVLVYIHGGGFVSGCNRSPWYRGTRFARDGVVVVSVGYRLGIEGFLDLADAPPNRAVLDWLAALEWVQGNIAAFGGDPSTVTIGGQSAGAAACLVLATNPRATGLFSRVIAMSGTSDTRMPRERLTELAEKMAAQLGVRATRDEFARFTPDELIETHAAVGTNPFSADAIGTAFDPRTAALKPFVDGDVIPEHPFRVIAEGRTSHIDLVASATANEINGMIHLNVDEESAQQALSAMGLVGEKLDRYMEHTRAENPVGAMAQAATDRAFRGNLAQLLADRGATGGRTFAYEYKRPSHLPGVGAAHCLDIPFVFDNLDAERVADGLIGPDAPQPLADLMHSSVVSFIETGDAGWPAYEAEARTVQVFDDTSRAVERYLDLELELFGRRSAT